MMPAITPSAIEFSVAGAGGLLGICMFVAMVIYVYDYQKSLICGGRMHKLDKSGIIVL